MEIKAKEKKTVWLFFLQLISYCVYQDTAIKYGIQFFLFLLSASRLHDRLLGIFRWCIDIIISLIYFPV